MAWKVTTDPASEPLTTAEVLNNLKLESSSLPAAETTLIETLIKAARQWVERHCNVGLLPQTITEVFDGFPEELSVGPVRSVTSISYKDSDGAVQTWTASNYVVDTYEQPARIRRAYGVVNPSLRDEINNVSAVYVIGYDDADALPAHIKQAMLLTIADAYENRENYVKQLPTAAEYILESGGIRIWRFR